MQKAIDSLLKPGSNLLSAAGSNLPNPIAGGSGGYSASAGNTSASYYSGGYQGGGSGGVY